jgi:outer membrane murein-binding lipoprotein Lpp
MIQLSSQSGLATVASVVLATIIVIGAVVYVGYSNNSKIDSLADQNSSLSGDIAGLSQQNSNLDNQVIAGNQQNAAISQQVSSLGQQNVNLNQQEINGRLDRWSQPTDFDP